MFLERIENFINLASLREEVKKIGADFVTADIVVVFINHFVGSKFSSMFLACLWIRSIGLLCLFFGVAKRRRK